MDKKAAAVSRAEVVRLWEALLDEEEDTEAAQALFMDALLRDARAEHARKEKHSKDEEDRFAHVFQPWHLPPRGSSVPPMPPPQPEQKPQPVAVPEVKRTLVLGLRAPTYLARNRKHDRAPPGTAAAGERHPNGKKPRVLL